MLFAGTGGLFAQDNTNLFWDDANDRLGIGTTAPVRTLHVTRRDASIGSANTAICMEHALTSGTAAVGMGVGFAAFLPSDTTPQQPAGDFYWRWVDPAHATRRSKFDLYVGRASGAALAQTWETDQTVQYTYLNGSPPASTILSKLGLGSAIVGGNASGTGLGVNFSTGYAGDFFNFQVNGTTRTRMAGDGSLGLGVASLNASAQLQGDTVTKGWLPPRWTTTEKNAIGTPATGLYGYDTTRNEPYYYNGTAWVPYSLGSAAMALSFPLAQGAAGTTVIAPASVGNKHKIVGGIVTLSAAGTIKFTDDAGDLTGAMDVAANSGFVIPASVLAMIETSTTNTALSIVTTGGAAKGVIRYLSEP